MKECIHVANAGGYWGDDPYALRRQVEGSLPLDYITIDFLAEITMSILQKQKLKNPQAGYAKDFLTEIEPVLAACVRKGITVIANAGGVNPKACAEALLTLGKKLDLSLRIAIVDGDDILSRVPELHAGGHPFKNMDTGENFTPYIDRLLCSNAYIGAMPIVKALEYKPHIVVCGRVTDTSITLAPAMFEFQWSADDYDKLAHGIVAGHIIECGAQSTGGNFTDWRKVPSFVDVGFPVVAFSEDGSFVVTKHSRSGGLVSCQTVREQLLYEMGLPNSYLTPDVVADFSTVQLEQIAPDRVRVWGIHGYAPTPFLKVSMAYADGFKCSGTLIVCGPDAREKSEVFARVFWVRFAQELARDGFEPLAEQDKRTEYVGDDSTHKGFIRNYTPSEILLRLGVRHKNEAVLHVFRKLLPSMILSGPAGVAVTGGAPHVSQIVTYWPALLPRTEVLPRVAIYELNEDSSLKTIFQNDGMPWPNVSQQPTIPSVVDSYAGGLLTPYVSSPRIRVPLMAIAHARSGDKGDTVNIGLIGRSPECYVWLRENITTEKISHWFRSQCRGLVHRYCVPNLWALNFLLEESLDGGGTLGLQLDAQGKTFSQALLRCEVDIPSGLLQTIAQDHLACPGELPLC